MTLRIAFQFFPFLNCKNCHGAKRSIQKPIPTCFGSVQVASVIGYFIPSKVPFLITQSWAILANITKSAQLWALKNGTFEGMKKNAI